LNNPPRLVFGEHKNYIMNAPHVKHQWHGQDWTGSQTVGRRTDRWMDNCMIKECQEGWERKTRIYHNLYQYLVCLRSMATQYWFC
jgi:hypothetical protein